MANSKNPLKGSHNKKNRPSAGAHAGRGFRYQDKFGALLAVQHYDGSAKIKKIIPEGIDDFEVHTEQGVILIDTKSNEEGSRNRTCNEDANVFQKLWRNSEELTDQAFEFHLVLNRGHKSYYSKLNKTPITETRLSDLPNLPSQNQKYSKSFVIIEPDPISKASKILTGKHDVPPKVAKMICLELSDKLGSLASQNKSPDPEKKYALFSSDIPSIIEKIVEICELSEIKALLLKGHVKYVDYSPAEVSSNFYLNVDVRPGHITAGQVVPQSKQVKDAEEKLKSNGSCLVTGPSGSGKSALMWQIVHSTRDEVCWFEVTNREKLDSKELTLFLNATSKEYRIGFVLDNINSDKVQLFEQLVVQTRTNENVWVLGSIRAEFQHSLTCLRSVPTLESKPDDEVAKSIYENLRDKKLTIVPYFKEAWQNSDNLLLEYSYQLVEENTLDDAILEQISSKLRSQSAEQLVQDDEFAILQAVMPVFAANGRVDVKTVKQSLNLRGVRFSKALQRLRNEFLVLDDDGDQIDGLHLLRSMATCKALTTLGISTKPELAKNALRHAKPSSLEIVTSYFVYHNWLNESELTSVIQNRFSGLDIDYDAVIAIANGVRQGKIKRVVDEWLKNDFSNSEFTPSIAIPISVYTYNNIESPFPPELHQSALELSENLSEQIDNIKIPESIVTILIEHFNQNYANMTPHQINELLYSLYCTKLNTQQLNLLKETKLDFSSIPLAESIKILESIEILSKDVQNAWISSINQLLPEQKLLHKLVHETPFALPIRYLEQGNRRIAIAYLAHSFSTESTVKLGQTCRDYARAILTVDNKINWVKTGFVDVSGKNSQIINPVDVYRNEATSPTHLISLKVATAIATNLGAKTWSQYLSVETQKLQILYENCSNLLNEMYRNISNHITIDGIAKVYDEIEQIVAPVDSYLQKGSLFCDLAPIHGITDVFGPSLYRLVLELPYSSDEFLRKINITRNALVQIRNEPWHLIDNGPPEVLTQIELLLNKLEVVVSDSKLNNAHPFEMYPNTKNFLMNSFDYIARKCSTSLTKRP